MKKGYPTSDNEEDPEDRRDARRAGIVKEQEEVQNDPKLRRMQDIRDLVINPDPNVPEEMEAAERGLSFARRERRARIKKRLWYAKRGDMLLNEAETQEEQRLINERIGKLNRGKQPNPTRRLDRQFRQPRPNWYDNLKKAKCQVCEKVVPLSQCAECKDSAYCSQQCQIEGCGEKHL
jgi:hypothetical protein